mgnify:FL=1
MENGKEFTCKECGDKVQWLTNKAGKRYLNEYMGGRKFPHHHSEQEVEIYLGCHQASLDRGEIVVEQVVEVIKGRKVPKGTTGIVFWVAPAADDWGVVKVGFKTAEDEKHFINIENLAARPINDKTAEWAAFLEAVQGGK